MSQWLTDLGLGEKVAGAFAAVLGAAVTVQTVLVKMRRTGLESDKVGAESDIVNGLREELGRLRQELEAATKRQREMDRKIHEQAIKLTKMETLLIRVCGHVEQHKLWLPTDIHEDIHRFTQASSEEGKTNT